MPRKLGHPIERRSWLVELDKEIAREPVDDFWPEVRCMISELMKSLVTLVATAGLSIRWGAERAPEPPALMSCRCGLRGNR